jgi:hypothetical protein
MVAYHQGRFNDDHEFLHGQRFLSFDLLNRANIVLLPKHDGA